ncbi:MAG: MBL fold metallo-hydrolase [Syntrophales bacterium]|nr:MBL fold metallo-hydrolase [Syntrophales bacterium]
MSEKRNYNRPVEVASGIFWVGYNDPASHLHCNPYLIVDNGDAAIIDAGSRPDFAIVMLKILQTGISPGQISTLIYHHADPDLCGSILHMIDMCNNPNLKILSDPKNNTFVSFYIERDKRHLLKSIVDYPEGFKIGNRVLKFYPTPYAHTAGNFVTYDIQTGTLFSSDLFGSTSKDWNLYLELKENCYTCEKIDLCDECPLREIFEFHRTVMPSEKSLRFALETIEKLDARLIAPQHGSLIKNKKVIDYLIKQLKNLKGVGIDGITV